MTRVQKNSKKTLTNNSGKEAKKGLEGFETDKLFDSMLSELYRESASIRCKPEISNRTLSMRFGSDY